MMVKTYSLFWGVLSEAIFSRAKIKKNGQPSASNKARQARVICWVIWLAIEAPL